MLTILLSCIWVIDKNPPGEPETCDEIEHDFDAEIAEIRSCTDDSQCGRPLPGTSCGCTRDLVARVDADLTAYERLLDAAADNACDLGFTSPCDCPEAYGFVCEAGVCDWDYAEGAYLPDCRADAGDTYQMDAASLAGDTLTVTVSYGGGCEPHGWTLCWPDGSFLESDPVQARLEIFHDANDDVCDAWLTEDVALDLGPLRDAWRASYGAGAGTIVVHVGETSLTYSF